MTPEEKKALLFVPCEVECPQQGLQKMCNPDMCVRYKAFHTGYMVGRKAAFEVYRRSFRRGRMAALNEFLERYKVGNKSRHYDKAQKVVMQMKWNLTKSVEEYIRNGYEIDRIDKPEEAEVQNENN